MKTRAAVLWDRNKDWSVEEIQLDPPRRTYGLDQVNVGYDDMRNGRNLRGVITF